MALYTSIPKDMNGIKEKLIWKLTKRQVIFFGIGFAIGLSIYWLTYKSVGTSTAAVLFFCFASPFFIMGIYERNGFTFDKIIANFLRHLILPRIRPYKTENIYRQITDTIKYKKEVEMLETGKKEVKSNQK